MIRPRGGARSVVAVLATLLVVSGVAIGAHRLVEPSFGGTSRLHAGHAALVNGLPALEGRDLVDPTDGRRWSAPATLVATVVLAAALLWRRVDDQQRAAGLLVPIASSGRDPPHLWS